MKASGAIAAATCIGADRLAAAATLNLPIGLQLYSVRNLLPKDFEGTLHQLAAAGYKEVEAAGYYDKTAAEFGNAMQRAGLRCVSTHHPLSQLKSQLDQLIQYGQALGLDYIICSSPGGARRDPAAKGELTVEDWRWIAGELNKIGAKVKAAGMTFGYHNHGPEFGSENGVVFYDELMRLTDPKLVVFELDCGWISAAGHDAAKYIAKAPERFPLLHVKDMAKGPNGGFHSTIMGRGVVDYRPILRAATSLKHYFVEQEEFEGDPLAALRQDADYMRRLDVSASLLPARVVAHSTGK
jgi:sugar phosphate isomerase/epimerase